MPEIKQNYGITNMFHSINYRISIIISLLLLLFLYSYTVYSKDDKYKGSLRHNNIYYVELGGNSGALSINYERKLMASYAKSDSLYMAQNIRLGFGVGPAELNIPMIYTFTFGIRNAFEFSPA